MSDISVVLPSNKALAPLYEKDHDEFSPWHAFMQLDQDGTLRFGRSYDRSWPFEVHYGVSQSWYIPAELSHADLSDLSQKLMPLFERIIDGLQLDWDERISQDRGVLSPDATDAKEEVQRVCDDLRDEARQGGVGVAVVEPYEIFQYDSLEDYDLSSNSSDSEIMNVAKDVEENEQQNGTMIYGDVFTFLKKWIEDVP